MKDKSFYTITKDEIHQQNMHLTVRNRCLQAAEKPQEAVRQEIAGQLFRIFRKYV